MTNQMLIGFGIFLWLYGTGTGFFAQDEEPKIRIPKWVSVLLLNFRQVTPVSTIFLQTWGILIILYGLFVAQIIPNPMLNWLIGMLGSLILTRVFIEILENAN